MSFDPNPQLAIAARKLASNFTNGSGVTLNKGMPVATLNNGLIAAIDVSDQDSVDSFVGILNQDTPNAASGQVLDSGRLEDFTTSFAIGDPVYIDKSGGLTNVPPSVGVNGFTEGDYVVFVGVIVVNEFNSSLKDIKILIEKVGDL